MYLLRGMISGKGLFAQSPLEASHHLTISSCEPNTIYQTPSTRSEQEHYISQFQATPTLDHSRYHTHTLLYNVAIFPDREMLDFGIPKAFKHV